VEGAAVSTPLEDLVVSLRAGGSLAWLCQHAQDCDAETALRRAWDTEIFWDVLLDFIEFVIGEDHDGPIEDSRYRAMLDAFWKSHDADILANGEPGSCTCSVEEMRPLGPCVFCCGAVRANFVLPGFSELQRLELVWRKR